MNFDVFIIGTSHPLQCGTRSRSAESIASFESEIRRVLSKCRIQRIVEEMSPDGLKDQKVSETVCQRIVKNITIEHFDLSAKDRANLSLTLPAVIASLGNGDITEETPSIHAFEDLVNAVRERLLVAQVLSGNEWPVLIVCGSVHAVPLRRLFYRLGVHTEIVHFDYDP